MKKFLMTVGAVGVLALTACSAPPASVEPAPATTSPATQARAAESTPAPKPAPEPSTAEESAAWPEVDDTEGPGQANHPFYQYLAYFADKAEPGSDLGWVALIDGAEDDGGKFNVYTVIDEDEFMNSRTASTDWDTDGVCIGAGFYATKRNEAKKANYKEVWLLGKHGDPIMMCDMNTIFADPGGDYAKGDN